MKKADIFALGMISWERIEGERAPQLGCEEWEVIRKEGPRFRRGLNSLSNECRDMVSAMLAEDPGKRPAAEEILNRWLLTDSEKELM